MRSRLRLSKPARRAYARLTGTDESVGSEFTEQRAKIRPRVEDGLALTPRRPSVFVEPEEDEVDPMVAAQSAEEPIVAPAESEAPPT